MMARTEPTPGAAAVVGCARPHAVSNAFRTLTGVTLLALMLAGVLALLSLLLMGTRTDSATHLHPTEQVRTAWTTRWQRDTDTTLFRSALSTRDGEAQPTLVGSTIFALGSDRRLHALDPRSGSDLAFDIGAGRRAMNFRASSSRLVVLARTTNPATGLPDTSLLGVDPSTRAVAWDQPLATDVYTDSLKVDTDTVYLGVGDSVDGAQWRILSDRGAAPSLHPRIRAYALANGAPRWEQALPERSETGPADDLGLTVVNGDVVATEFTRGTSDGLVVLDRTNGQILLRALTGTQALGTLRNRLVAVAGADVLTMNPTNGAIVDRLSGLAPMQVEATLVSGSALYWTGSDQVGALDLNGKKPLWPPTQLDYPTGAVTSKALTRPDVQDGHLYVGGRDDAIYSIDVRTGSVEWKFSAPLRAPPSTDYAPLRVADLVLVQDGQLTAYQAPR